MTKGSLTPNYHQNQSMMSQEYLIKQNLHLTLLLNLLKQLKYMKGLIDHKEYKVESHEKVIKTI